jgi:excisionase family DNA binding protein
MYWKVSTDREGEIMNERIKYELLNSKEAAEYLGLKVSYIYNLVNKGQLKALKCGNSRKGSLRFTIEELNRFLGVNNDN